MDYISSDTNVWLDFFAINQTALPFRLPYTYIMFEEALRKEILSPPDLLMELGKLGLKGVDITTVEFYYAMDLSSRYVKLSGYDRIALAIAKQRNIPLLTGDMPLREAAKAEGVRVFGTIGLLDTLFYGGYISISEYLSCLEDFLKHKERRLPAEELRRRISDISNAKETE